MSEREISPWPWRLWDETMGAQILDAEGNLICFVESTDNAHTMVTAPELLEALENTLLEYVQLVASGDCGFWSTDREGHVIAARAAIAKAKGVEL